MRIEVKFGLAVFIAIVSAAQGGEQKAALKSNAREAAHEDLEKLQGTWDRVSMELEGEEWPAEKIEGWTAMYEGDRLTLRVNGKVYRNSIVTLDPSRSPRAMNSWDLDGPAEDETVPGIYQINDDTMKVCFAKPGNKRPTEFTSKKGGGFIYCEYKKAPK
jgi:uncharacterized protein (TIGR03067 family)